MTSNRAEAILHPTDLTLESEAAFAHALRLAINNQARLYILHVHPGSRDDVPWHEYPSVRGTLERWGFLQPGASRKEVGVLGIEVEKVVGDHKDIVKSITGFQYQTPIDFMVLATEGHSGILRWIKPSIAEPAARGAQVPTLFVPKGVRGCVSMEAGSVTMSNVLVPVDHQPGAQEAIARAIRAIESFGSEHSVLTLMHVGDETDFPELQLPGDVPWKTARIACTGDAAPMILEQAEKLSADLLIMVTEGHHGFLDVLRGNTTERVLRRAPCPVLAIPANF